MNERNRKYILELYKIVSPTSILVVSPAGKLKRLNCPFRVIALVDIAPEILQGKHYLVDFVKMTLDLKLVYIIGGRAYLIGDFSIMG